LAVVRLVWRERSEIRAEVPSSFLRRKVKSTGRVDKTMGSKNRKARTSVTYTGEGRDNEIYLMMLPVPGTHRWMLVAMEWNLIGLIRRSGEAGSAEKGEDFLKIRRVC
jgi:hypothetical protein